MSKQLQWKHPGGKLRELGAEGLTDAELLAVLIGTGTSGKTAEDIAKDVLEKFGGFKGMSNQLLDKFLKFKGIGDVKLHRIVAAFEIARRIVNEVLKDHEREEQS